MPLLPCHHPGKRIGRPAAAAPQIHRGRPVESAHYRNIRDTGGIDNDTDLTAIEGDLLLRQHYPLLRIGFSDQSLHVGAPRRQLAEAGKRSDASRNVRPPHP